MNDSEHWDHLCREYDAADKEVNEAWLVVQGKFRAIAARTSTENPTNEELQRLEHAKERRTEVDNRMKAFMKEKFGVDS